MWVRGPRLTSLTHTQTRAHTRNTLQRNHNCHAQRETRCSVARSSSSTSSTTRRQPKSRLSCRKVFPIPLKVQPPHSLSHPPPLSRPPLLSLFHDLTTQHTHANVRAHAYTNAHTSSVRQAQGHDNGCNDTRHYNPDPVCRARRSAPGLSSGVLVGRFGSRV